MQPSTGTLLIAQNIAAGWGRQQAEDLARSLEARLNQPVVLSFPDNSASGIAGGVESLANTGARRIVVIPLGLLPIPEHGAIPLVLARAKRQYPDLGVHAAQPLSWLEWSRWAGQTAMEAATKNAISPGEAGLLYMGNGSTNPMKNADLARLAQLVRESSPFAIVNHAFLGDIRPGIQDAIRTMSDLGLQIVVVVPWTLNEQEASRRLDKVVPSDKFTVLLANPSLAHPALINLLVSNHYSALADQAIEYPSVLGCSDQPTIPSTRTDLTTEEAFELRDLERRINLLLPSEYQGRYETVSPESMGSADLKYDNDGKVAWGEIWTSFCDLALAGGPPHRGTLLEAVTAAEALAEREQYDAVVAEIERGIGLVTSLPVITSQIPGWVGVRCESEEMAIWLMRAIIVENIMVRREADVLYLPAGPRFTLRREIKNVVTSIAKTIHYWKTHLKLARADSFGVSRTSSNESEPMDGSRQLHQ